MHDWPGILFGISVIIGQVANVIVALRANMQARRAAAQSFENSNKLTTIHEATNGLVVKLGNARYAQGRSDQITQSAEEHPP